ncbi:MAG: glucose-6-phosphate isomerase [Candidatus Caldatribacteriaceae bacterium]
MKIMEPFNVVVNLQTGELLPGKKVLRRMSDIKALFLDQKEAETLVQNGDPLVYEVIYADVPEEEGHLGHCTTIIYPGKVGEEFFFTKGHRHEKLGTAEIYFCLQGKGKLLMESVEGDCKDLDMFPGSASYIPPYWSHRTVNIGNEPLVFYCVFPADAGHDYATIERDGFPKLVVERNGQVILIDNPKWKKGV